jgi:hypothetical protein
MWVGQMLSVMLNIWHLHGQWVWITHSKCGSAIQLEQLEEFACDTYFTHILNVWIQKWFSHILTTHFTFVGNSIVKYLVGFIVLTYSSTNFDLAIWFLPITYLIANLTNVEEYVKDLQATNMRLCLQWVPQIVYILIMGNQVSKLTTLWLEFKFEIACRNPHM